MSKETGDMDTRTYDRVRKLVEDRYSDDLTGRDVRNVTQMMYLTYTDDMLDRMLDADDLIRRDGDQSIWDPSDFDRGLLAAFDDSLGMLVSGVEGANMLLDIAALLGSHDDSRTKGPGMSEPRCPRCGSRRIHGDSVFAGLGALGEGDYLLTCLDCKDYSPHSTHSLEEAMAMWEASVMGERGRS